MTWLNFAVHYDFDAKIFLIQLPIVASFANFASHLLLRLRLSKESACVRNEVNIFLETQASRAVFTFS